MFDAVKTKIDDMLEQLEKLGANEESNEYSADPVNLATGNFVYDYEDIKTGGDIPLTFPRYYNAMDEEKTSLGLCFMHNYKMRITYYRTFWVTDGY